MQMMVCIDEDGTDIIICFNDAYNLFKCNSFHSNTVTLGLLQHKVQVPIYILQGI